MSEPFTSGTNYVYSKTGVDGNTVLGQCGFSIPPYDTIQVFLNDSSPWHIVVDSIGCQQNSFNVNLSDYVYCYTVDQDASSLRLIDAGNGNNVIPITSSYTYCGPSGDSLSDKILINFPSNQPLTGPLYLMAQNGTDNNTIASSCGRFFNVGDTIAVYYVKNVSSISLGPDIDVCANNYELPVLLNTGYAAGGGISFQWYLNESLINGATYPAYYANDSGLYKVIAYSSANCWGSDSVIVNVISASEFDLGGDRNICIGDIVHLDMGNGGMIYQWFVDGWAEDQDTFPMYDAIYDAEYIGLSITYNQSGHLCFSSDTVIVTSWPYPVPVLSNQTICNNILPYIIDAGNPGASYLWLAELLDTLQTYNAYGSGTYVVTITNFPGCSIQDSMILTFENQLDAPILDCGTLQGGGYSTVYTWSDVSGNAGYEVSFDSINWVPANTPVSVTSHGTNSFSTTIYIRAIMTGLCTYGKSSSPFDCIIIMPNIITPNGDGQNDALIIANINQYPDNTFRILNRWGIEVYAEKGYNNTTRVFNGEGMAPDRYFYILDLGNGADRKSGTLLISQ